MTLRSLELLAPAKNVECGIAAIDHGADAVYIGAPRFGARASAGNSVPDIARLCQYAHQFGAKVYATLNTIVYDKELDESFRLLDSLQAVGVDAFLVQDMAFLQALKDDSFTNVPIFHASTQTDNRTIEKVRWLSSLGIRRVVLARELSLAEIAEIHRECPDVELEVFIHGALCVSFSGGCYASQYHLGRSANRGECAQFCRMKFDLVDATGKEWIHQRHLLSLKDMCRIDALEDLAAAGVTSFKIEGRLKDLAYVKTVVTAYSQRLNDLVSRHPHLYCRASLGCSEATFKPDCRKVFNRGFTTYLLHGSRDSIASIETPKFLGECVGTVKDIRRTSIRIAGTASFFNGDGLCFFNEQGKLEGFRVNGVVGNLVMPFRMPRKLKVGMSVYRNQDMAFERQMEGKTATRKIPISMTFRPTATGFNLQMCQGDVLLASVDQPVEKVLAHNPQDGNMEAQLTKLGTTRYVCKHFLLADGAAQYFVPNSVLSQMRQQLVAQAEAHAFSPCSTPTPAPPSCKKPLPAMDWDAMYRDYPYLHNVANRMARQFYAEHGMDVPMAAMEVAARSDLKFPLLMQCRHCIRHALGHCVRHGGTCPPWREPLFLRLANGSRFRLQFLCGGVGGDGAGHTKPCQMNVYAE